MRQVELTTTTRGTEIIIQVPISVVVNLTSHLLVKVRYLPGLMRYGTVADHSFSTTQISICA